MADYILYHSAQELREHISDLDDLLSDYDKTQEVLDEQRGVLVDQVQGALAIYEKQVSDYEQKRDDLERRQQELSEHRSEAEKNREVLQHQLDAKLGKSVDDKTGPKADASDPKKSAGQADGLDQPTGPTTREQIERLEAQLSKPQPELTFDPPGMGPSQASVIDKDLKLMTKIKEKKQKMDDASQNLKDDWNNAKGPKVDGPKSDGPKPDGPKPTGQKTKGPHR